MVTITNNMVSSFKIINILKNPEKRTAGDDIGW